MKNLMLVMKEKRNRVGCKIAIYKMNAKKCLGNEKGENYVDTGVKILIAVVLGALLLAGLYALFGDVVMPTLTEKIKEMFNYKG